MEVRFVRYSQVFGYIVQLSFRNSQRWNLPPMLTLLAFSPLEFFHCFSWGILVGRVKILIQVVAFCYTSSIHKLQDYKGFLGKINPYRKV